MKLIRFAVLACAAAIFSTSAFAQLPTQKVLTIDIAQTLAHDAMMQCRANGYHVSVRVVDGSNVLKAFLRDDGARPATVVIGEMKANSVMAFGRPSGPPANLPPGTPAPAPILPGTINAQGGLPIMAGGQLVGSISVSGAPGGDKDAACAKSALDKVQDKLK
jgi:uncharacterized protein GlcG (DUF336 family)